MEGLISSGVPVQVQYNDNKKKKEEVKTELTIHQVGYNHRAITSEWMLYSTYEKLGMNFWLN